MPLMPSRIKYRKAHKPSIKGEATSGNFVAFGEYGLQSLDRGWLEARQIEAGRVAINRHLKRKGKLWIRVFPDRPMSKKPIEVRMGSGKGPPEFWVAAVRRGTMLFEIDGVPEPLACAAMRLAASKLPFRTRFVARRNQI